MRSENEEIAMVFMLTRRQYIVAENGRIVDISIPALKTVMDLMGIKNQKDCMARVVKTFHHFLSEKQ